MIRAGLRSLALAFPGERRDNQWYRDRYPEEVRAVEDRRARALPNEVGEIDPAMAPYLDDPFRGTVQRFALAPGETALDIEIRAARQALARAEASASSIDLLISTAFPSDQPGVGQAAFLARALGLGGAAWNMESTCSSSLVALQTACGLVTAGQYRRVLVVSSCTYSRLCSGWPAWVSGDGAGAFVVTAAGEGEGLLGMSTVHTGDTCGVFENQLVVDDGTPRIRMRADPRAATFLQDTLRHMPECCGAAAAQAGVALADVDAFVFNTPIAWFTQVAARTLGIDPRRTVSAYPFCANVGPALMPTNLLLAAKRGRIRRGDLVMLYGVGSVSTASASLLRWGDVALGEAPPGLLELPLPPDPPRSAVPAPVERA